MLPHAVHLGVELERRVGQLEVGLEEVLTCGVVPIESQGRVRSDHGSSVSVVESPRLGREERHARSLREEAIEEDAATNAPPGLELWVERQEAGGPLERVLRVHTPCILRTSESLSAVARPNFSSPSALFSASAHPP